MCGDALRTRKADASPMILNDATFLGLCDLAVMRVQKNCDLARALVAPHLLVARARHHFCVIRTAYLPLI